MKRKEVVTFIFAAVLLCAGRNTLFSEEASETKSIAFTKNVVVKKYKQGEVHAEPYTVQENDTLWKILVEGYGVKDNQFYFFCRITKSLNPDLKDADQLVPDQLLLIPYKYITHFNIPEDTMRAVIRSVLSMNVSQIATEDHTVSKGEHLAQVLRDMYNIPDDLIFDEYLELVKRLNPELEDVDLVVPNQRVTLPSVAAFQLSSRVKETAREVVQEEVQEEVQPELTEEPVNNELVEKKDLSKESIAAGELQAEQG
ncbi:MAG: LysM domain-containing protein, partial [Thermodesulfobacteriota bacterium]|nr:LysM domain-containing protein [Thermodesulfobacteriota bacterium]